MSSAALPAMATELAGPMRCSPSSPTLPVESRHGATGDPPSGEFSDDPLADAVYRWVAFADGSAPEGCGDALTQAFDTVASTTAVLWRGLDSSWPLPVVGGWWSAAQARGPWSAFTSRIEFAALWADTTVLEVHDATGVDLARLVATHPSFRPLVGEDDDARRDRLHYDDMSLDERIASEREWLVRGTFAVTGTRSEFIAGRSLTVMVLRAAGNSPRR
jgi:hypothetical protein